MIATQYKNDIQIIFHLFALQIDGLCIISTITNILGTFGMLQPSIIPRQAAKMWYLCTKTHYNYQNKFLLK